MQVVRICQIENRITDYDRFLLVFSDKSATQGIVASFHHYLLANPLPKLVLSSPILLAVTANDQGVFLLFFLIFFNLLAYFFCHFHCPFAAALTPTVIQARVGSQ